MKLVPLSIKTTDEGFSSFSIGINSIFPLNYSDAFSISSKCLGGISFDCVSVKWPDKDFLT